MILMNRLQSVWMFFVTWARGIRASEVLVNDTMTTNRKLRQDAKQQKRDAVDSQSTVEDMTAEIGELRSDVKSRDIEIERLTLRVDLLQTSLDFQLLWREKEVERMKQEQAVHIRNRVEATSSPQADGFLGMGD